MANSKKRSASKKNYCTKNANGAISNRNRDRRMATAKRRAEYWATAAGQERRNAKLNTPEKVQARADAKVARNNRRRERKLAEQKAAREETLKVQNEKA